MSQVGTAALMLAAVTLAYLAVVYAVWRARRPRAAKQPKAPRAPGESRRPRLPRRHREVEELVEMSPARLARIGDKARLERLAGPPPETDADSDAAFVADSFAAERSATVAPFPPASATAVHQLSD